jgi:hypothetical protein
VLEQDLRVREQLRNTLGSIYGSSEFAVIEPLLRVKQPNSVSWLIDAMADALRELQPAEHVGAAAILARILPETHARFESVFAYFDAADPELLALIARSRSDGRADLPFAPWFIRVLMRSLARTAALGLSGRGLKSISDELRRHTQEIIEKRAREAGLSLDDSRLLQWLGDEPQSFKSTGDSSYGFVAQGYFATDWSTPRVRRIRSALPHRRVRADETIGGARRAPFLRPGANHACQGVARTCQSAHSARSLA